MIVDPQGRRCGCGRDRLLGDRGRPARPARRRRRRRRPGPRPRPRRSRPGSPRSTGAPTSATPAPSPPWTRSAAGSGVGAAILANALNPGAIVLSGYFAEVGRRLRAAVEAQLEAGVLAPRAGGTRVELSTLGFTAAVRGGATVALESVFDDPTRVERQLVRRKGGPMSPATERRAQPRPAPDDRHRQGFPGVLRPRRRRPRRARRRGALPARPERRRQVDADQGARPRRYQPDEGTIRLGRRRGRPDLAAGRDQGRDLHDLPGARPGARPDGRREHLPRPRARPRRLLPARPRPTRGARDLLARLGHSEISPTRTVGEPVAGRRSRSSAWPGRCPTTPGC